MAGPSKHHLFGGSNAKQVMACGHSIQMRMKYPSDVDGPAAAEGTRLHALMEHCLRNGEWDAFSYVGGWLEDETPADGAEGIQPFTKDQCAAVSVILRYVAELMLDPEAELYVETALTLYDIDVDAGGTGDVFIWTPSRGHMIDAKFGAGIAVEVENNDQCHHYLAGWRRKLGERMPFDLTMTIIQPRKPHADGPIRSSDTDLMRLMEWEDRYGAAVKKARDPKCSPVVGDHCTFCPGTRLGADGKYPCAAFDAKTTGAKDSAFDLVDDMREVQALDAETLGRRFSELAVLRKYIRDMESLVKTRARTELPEGYDWAPGGRSWSWRGADGDIFDMVRVLHGDVYAREIVKLVTALSPDVFADVADMIEKGTAAPSLVKKGTRKSTLSLPEVQAYFAGARDDAFDEIE